MRYINYLFLILLFSLLFIIACSNAETPTGNVIKEPEKSVCNKPYFEFQESYCCLDKNDNSICYKDEESEKEKANQITAQVIAENNENPETTQPIEKLETKPGELSYIDQQELIGNIKDIMDADYYNFERDPSHPGYTRSSKLKYYVIHTPDDDKHAKNAKEFCDTYCAQNWDGWKY